MGEENKMERAEERMGLKKNRNTAGKKLKREIDRLWSEEDGVGVIELVLILVVLIGLVIIFKKQITTLLQNIFKEINNQSKEVY